MKLLLIEDHPIVRAGCARVLSQREGLEVIEAETAAAGLLAMEESRPELVVLDLNLPDRRGLELLADIVQRWPSSRVIIFSMYEDAAFVSAGLKAGARGYVSKNDDPDSLLEAIDTVLAGKQYVSKVVGERLNEGREKAAIFDSLSDRERRLLVLMAQGQSLGEAAYELGVSYRTTAEEAAKLRTRFGLRTNAALIRLAVDHGLA